MENKEKYYYIDIRYEVKAKTEDEAIEKLDKEINSSHYVEVIAVFEQGDKMVKLNIQLIDEGTLTTIVKVNNITYGFNITDEQWTGSTASFEVQCIAEALKDYTGEE